LGFNQYDWLTSELLNSKNRAKWRVLGNQKIMSGWYYNQQLSFLPIPNDGAVFDAKTWDGFMEERELFFDFLAQNNVKNNVALSGDSHISMIMELTKDPTNSSIYNPSTGQGAVGVEFLPTSISRGNFDEQGVSSFLIPTAQTLSLQFNPHHRYSEFTKHGYGILDVKKDSTTAEFWYCDILQVTNTETFSRAYVTKDQANHWQRYFISQPTSLITSAKQDESLLGKPKFNIYPNPANSITNVELLSNNPYIAEITIRDFTGKIVYTQKHNSTDFINIDTTKYPSGLYIITVVNTSDNKSENKKLLINN
jgi:alkaline phosphatase D